MPETTDQKQGKPPGRYVKGQSGNPLGRPVGARHKTTLSIEALLEGEAEAITRKAIEAAKDGDMIAIRLVLDRIAPARRDRTIGFNLPPLMSSEDAVSAMALILAGVADGELTPSEANDLSRMVDAFTKAIEANDLSSRILALEQRMAS